MFQIRTCLDQLQFALFPIGLLAYWPVCKVVSASHSATPGESAFSVCGPGGLKSAVAMGPGVVNAGPGPNTFNIKY